MIPMIPITALLAESAAMQEGQTEFSKLSQEAQDAIVSAFLGDQTPFLSDAAREEIRAWAESPDTELP